MVALLTSVSIQLFHGIDDIQLGVYLWGILVNWGVSFYFIAGLALLLQPYTYSLTLAAGGNAPSISRRMMFQSKLV